MGPGALIWILVGLWAVTMGAALVAGFTIEPTGDSFTRGMNRFTAVLGWLGAGFLVALVSVFVGGRAETKAMRWLGRAPILVHLLLALVVAGIIAYTLMTNPVSR